MAAVVYKRSSGLTGLTHALREGQSYTLDRRLRRVNSRARHGGIAMCGARIDAFDQQPGGERVDCPRCLILTGPLEGPSL